MSRLEEAESDIKGSAVGRLEEAAAERKAELYRQSIPHCERARRYRPDRADVVWEDRWTA